MDHISIGRDKKDHKRKNLLREFKDFVKRRQRKEVVSLLFGSSESFEVKTEKFVLRFCLPAIDKGITPYMVLSYV